MKKYLYLVLLNIALLNCTIRLTGQTANCETCKNQKFTYLGCDQSTGTMKEICTDNPRGLDKETQFWIWKKCLPMNITFGEYPDDLYFDRIYYKDNNQNDITIFSVPQAVQLGEAGLLEWEDICTPNPNPDPDCIPCGAKIVWARDPNIFVGGADHTWARADMKLYGECGMNCNTSFIYINVSDIKIKPDPDMQSAPEVFYYTNRNISTGMKATYRDFRSMITHEIGHWLGLGHNGSLLCNLQANSSKGIMDAAGLGSAFPGEADEYHMNFYDKCQFMKLYCCDATSDVDEKQPNKLGYIGDVKVHPNPANNTITFDIPQTLLGKKVRIQLFDLIGELVFDYEYEVSATTYSVEVSKLSVGMYFAYIHHSNIELNKGMIIIER